MANTVIALKKSGTPAATPASLEFGELAINYADGILYYKAANGTIYPFSSGGNAFATVNANGTLVIADTSSDVFSLEPGSFINITGDAINDKITISANLKAVYDAANAAFAQANTVSSDADEKANVAIVTANAAFLKANANNGVGNSSSGQVLFNDSGMSNGSSNLTFNKTTGTLNVVNINITGTASYISANSILIGDSEVNSIILITSTTNDQIIDSFANTTWRSAHYHITMNAGTDYQTTQISLIHDGFKAYMTEYGMIANANNLGIFTTVVTNGSVRLNIIPSFSATTIRMFRTTNK